MEVRQDDKKLIDGILRNAALNGLDASMDWRLVGNKNCYRAIEVEYGGKKFELTVREIK